MAKIAHYHMRHILDSKNTKKKIICMKWEIFILFISIFHSLPLTCNFIAAWLELQSGNGINLCEIDIWWWI